MSKKILVTGGAGFIGSHTCIELLNNGNEVVVVDNLYNANKKSLEVVEKVTGKKVTFYEVDIRDEEKLNEVFETEKDIFGVIHFAGLKAVGESCALPLKYYDNNVVGTWSLLEAMRLEDISYLVFSSTAAVYGEPEKVPIIETDPYNPTNVYGQTKLMIEMMLEQFHRAYGLNYAALRYFNAAGASPDGTIGEDHHPETHLIPLILQAAAGRRASVGIFGTDYSTPDGTCIRDYIHVTDLAEAHCRVLDYLVKGGKSQSFNLGSQHGFSVREMIDAAKKVTGRDFAVTEEERRAGDPAVLIASSERLRQVTGWSPVYSDVETIIAHAWKWHQTHPNGYM